jgi:hypothetical protein
MRHKLIPAESTGPIATVWQKLGKAEQQLAIDLISNIICDYYLSQKKGESDHESNRGKPD